MLKRLIESFGSIVVLFLVSPLLFLIAYLIWREDKGQVFFLQERLGQNKKPFLIYKFRTFRDGKVTQIGKFLRARGLDELPQLFNILLGQMSIVGPRPLTQTDVIRLKWNGFHHLVRWQTKPGITGLGQIYAGVSAKVTWFYDKKYIDQQSVLLDLGIIFLTVIMCILDKYKVRQLLRNKKLNKRIKADKSIMPSLRESERSVWHYWSQLFEARRHRQVLPLKKTDVYKKLPQSLANSLAIFQLGESGGGTIVAQVAASKLKGVDDNYRSAMKYFVQEEHRHAQILAKCVEVLGGKLLKENWTDNLFVYGRRLMGVRFKVLVLLAAEVVGITYYRLLASRLSGTELQSRLNEIVEDEQSHLHFHCEFLKCQASNVLKRMIFSLAWFSVIFAAMLVVLIDHRRALKDLGIPIGMLVKRWTRLSVYANDLVIGRPVEKGEFARIDALYI